MTELVRPSLRLSKSMIMTLMYLRISNIRTAIIPLRWPRNKANERRVNRWHRHCNIFIEHGLAAEAARDGTFRSVGLTPAGQGVADREYIRWR